MKMAKRLTIASGLLAITMAFAAMTTAKEPKKADDAPAEVRRARRTVKMLDDIYKTAVVLITDKYVHSEDDFPAGGAAVALFDAIKKKGWHEVRLLDATGEPYDDKNVARDKFDKQAIKALKSGKSYLDKVETVDGKRVLRAATPIPVVMKKCVLCHAHYAKAKKNEPIGILSYSIPLDDD